MTNNKFLLPSGIPDEEVEPLKKILEMYEQGSDDALRYLYQINFFNGRIMEIVHNPEPLEDENAVMDAAQLMSGDEVFALAQRYALGKDVPRNYIVSEQLLEIAVGKGHATSLYTLTGFKQSGILDGEFTLDEILDGYKQAYEMGCQPAAEKAADFALRFCNDVEEAAKYYKISGEQGNVECMLHYVLLAYTIGRLNGEDDEELNQSAISIIQSLPQDNVAVLNQLAEIYRDGLFGQAVDYYKAWEYSSQAANDNSYSDIITTIFNISMPLTSIGYGLDYDFPLPQKVLVGSGEAMYWMATMILKGQHLDSEIGNDEAWKMVAAAAERGHINAILLQNAINRDADEDEIQRLVDGDYNQEEIQWFVDTSDARGDTFAAGLNQLMLNLQQMSEQNENQDD